MPQTCSIRDLPNVWETWQSHGATRLVTLLGQPVAHSISPVMHQAAFAARGWPYVYIACDVVPGELADALALLAELGAAGCNVTIPHKEAALALAAERSDTAAAAGAANCLTWRDGRWHAANTDAPGLVTALGDDHGLHLSGRAGVVIGTGGFARAAVVALCEAGCRSVTVLGRRPDAAAALAATVAARWHGLTEVAGVALDGAAADRALADAAVCVNATPVGMWPHVEHTPLDPARLGANCFVYDSIYNPGETRLLREAKARGLRGANGLSLLVRQGALSWQHWFGSDAPVTVMQQAALQAV